MFRKLKLATILAVAIGAVGPMSSADAHIGLGGRGGGIRIGGGGGIGIGPRARQQGNANQARPNGNPPVASAPNPAPKAPAAAPVVQKQTVPAANATTNKPNVANATVKNATAPKTINDKVQTPNVQAKTPAVTETVASKSASDSVKQEGRLVFSLSAVSTDATEATATPSAGLPSETKKALEEVIATDAPAAENTPREAKPEVVTKEVPLPQVPVGATLTLKGKDLSNKEGQVVLQIGEIALPATINDWKNDAVTCTLPVIGITRASKATLHVLKADGKTASMMNFELVTTLTADAKP